MPTDTNQRATTVRNQDITEISVDCWKNSENKLKIIKIILETKTVTPKTLNRTVTSILTTTKKTVTEPRESRKLVTHPVRHVEKQTTPQWNATLEPIQPIDRLPAQKTGKTESGPRESQSTLDDNISPVITTSQVEERLVRDDITNELYMPLSSIFVLRGQKKMLYVALDFDNGFTKDAPVDPGASC